MKPKIELYGDGIGAVEYVEHMGSDLTVVNSARVSFGKHKKDLHQKYIYPLVGGFRIAWSNFRNSGHIFFVGINVLVLKILKRGSMAKLYKKLG